MDATKTGAYLAALRKARGLTQQEAAERLGVSNKTVSKWESGGGFPEITVLPALAELYGVTADDLLAGETLAGSRRPGAAEAGTEQKKRLLARLLTRFGLCFAAALALALLAALRVPYVSVVSLPLSLAALWWGYILVAHPLRLQFPEEGAARWTGLFRGLAAGTAAQLAAFFYLLRLGDLGNLGDLWAWYLRLGLEPWSPALLTAGLLALWGAFQWGLRRAAGKGARLVPPAAAPWVLWALVLFAAWRTTGRLYGQAAAPLEEQLRVMEGYRVIGQLREYQAQALRPYLWAKRGALAAGALWGLGLAVTRLRRQGRH